MKIRFSTTIFTILFALGSLLGTTTLYAQTNATSSYSKKHPRTKHHQKVRPAKMQQEAKKHKPKITNKHNKKSTPYGGSFNVTPTKQVKIKPAGENKWHSGYWQGGIWYSPGFYPMKMDCYWISGHYSGEKWIAGHRTCPN